jgi:NADH:ubiquinone oxidoreductase subunit F (NADH-binding)
MSTMGDDVQQRVQKLEEGMAVAEATQAGAQATQAAAQAGMAAAVMAGAGAFVAGMLLALLIALVGRD